MKQWYWPDQSYNYWQGLFFDPKNLWMFVKQGSLVPGAHSKIISFQISYYNKSNVWVAVTVSARILVTPACSQISLVHTILPLWPSLNHQARQHCPNWCRPSLNLNIKHKSGTDRHLGLIPWLPWSWGDMQYHASGQIDWLSANRLSQPNPCWNIIANPRLLSNRPFYNSGGRQIVVWKDNA